MKNGIVSVLLIAFLLVPVSFAQGLTAEEAELLKDQNSTEVPESSPVQLYKDQITTDSANAIISDLSIQILELKRQIEELIAAQGLKTGSSDTTGAVLLAPTTDSGSTFTSTSGCYNFTRSLSPGMRDSEYRNDITLLQEFLISQSTITGWPSGQVATGYYGSVTQHAVELLQAYHGVVYSGTPKTTGYGLVGPQTRELIRNLTCNDNTSTNTPPPQVCTLDAMVCPDGSTVGRVLPNCEFAACPSTPPVGNDSVPTITSISPTSATPGQSVTVTGRNITLYNNTVILRGLTSSGSNLWNRQISGLTGLGNQVTFTVPSDAPVGDYYVDIRNQYGTSEGYPITVTSSSQSTEAPQISYVSPSYVAPGQVVTVMGENFTLFNNTVNFRTPNWNKNVTGISSLTSRSLEVRIPSDAPDGSYYVDVLNQYGVSNPSFPITVTSAMKPVITSVSPDSARVGDTVTVNGRNFAIYTNTVILRGLSSSSGGLWTRRISNLAGVTNQLTFTVPLDAPVGNYFIDVENQYGLSDGVGFSVTN